MYAAEDKAVLERAIKVRMLAKLGMPANGKALSGGKGYAALDKALPPKTSAFAFVNIEKVAEVSPPTRQEDKQRVAKIVKNLMLGAGVQIKEDMIEIVVSANRDIGLADLAGMVCTDVREIHAERETPPQLKKPPIKTPRKTVEPVPPPVPEF